MSKFCSVIILAIAVCVGSFAATPKKDACASCHPDFAKVLSKNHAAVEKGGVEQCLACHAVSDKPEKNVFSTRVHLAHESSKQKLECTTCHTFEAGKKFGLIGQDVSYGAPKDEDIALMKKEMTSWATSKFTDNLHAKAGVDCSGCHGKDAPVADSTVENERCLSCHGPVEKLAAKSANAEFPKRNPHASHYGNDIACTTCHKAHEASVVMCAGCHKLWTLKIPGDGQ